ncbi:MAG: hypothetical protein MUE71_00330 [Chitinophagaceae bacterium]|jgi:hypothetical protein|nr:hypothetical protein [Chitinophagaceae bacterium]
MKLIKSLTTWTASAGLLFVLGLTACQKDNSETTAVSREETENLTLASEEDAIADLIFTEIHEQELGMLDDLGMPGIGLNDEQVGLDTAGRCLKITITPRDPGVFPKTFVFDYGDGCKGRDGRVRKGKMITVYSNPMVKPGATAVTTFDNFHVEGIKVQGRHTTKNNSTSTVRIFTRTVQDGKLTFPNNRGVAIWSGTHTNKQIAGLGTPGFPLDDEFEITGGARGVFENASKRIEWSRVIIEPLYKTFKCRWVSKGVVHITRNNNKAILNYGDGTCDNKAVIIINGERKEITL